MYSGENEYSMMSAGVIYEVLEQKFRNAFFIPFKTASPGTRTGVSIKKHTYKKDYPIHMEIVWNQIR